MIEEIRPADFSILQPLIHRDLTGFKFLRVNATDTILHAIDSQEERKYLESVTFIEGTRTSMPVHYFPIWSRKILGLQAIADGLGFSSLEQLDLHSEILRKTNSILWWVTQPPHDTGTPAPFYIFSEHDTAIVPAQYFNTWASVNASRRRS